MSRRKVVRSDMLPTICIRDPEDAALPPYVGYWNISSRIWCGEMRTGYCKKSVIVTCRNVFLPLDRCIQTIRYVWAIDCRQALGLGCCLSSCRDFLLRRNFWRRQRHPSPMLFRRAIRLVSRRPMSAMAQSMTPMEDIMRTKVPS